MYRLRALTVLASLAFLVVTPLDAEDRQSVSIDDVYRIDGPTDVTVAPDGGSAVFIRRWNDRPSRSTRFSLWRAVGSADQAKPLEKGEPDVRRFVLSPNGKWIAFLSTRPQPDGSPSVEALPPYSDVATDIWLLPAEGGRAIPLATRGKQYGRVFSDPFYAGLAFSPDGKRLAFVADEGLDPRTPAEIENNVQIVREDQGEGYQGYTAAQIWIADLDPDAGGPAKQIRRVTNDNAWYGDPQWAPDGKSLVVHANRTDDRESVRYSINKNYDLWRINLADNSLAQLTNGPGPEVSPRFSPDGKQLVCLSIPRKGSHMDCFNLLLIDLEASGPRSRVLFDHHGPEAEQPPHLSPAFPLPLDCWVSSGKVRFNAMHRTGTPRQVVDVEKNTTVTEDAPTDAAAREKLVPAGNRFLQERSLAKSEIVTWKSFDGQAVEGVLTRPNKPGAKAGPARTLRYLGSLGRLAPCGLMW